MDKSPNKSSTTLLKNSFVSLSLTMKYFLIATLALIGTAAATVVPCTPDKGPFPMSVTIQDCDADERCSFVRGKSFKADITFTASKINHFSVTPDYSLLAFRCQPEIDATSSNC